MSRLNIARLGLLIPMLFGVFFQSFSQQQSNAIGQVKIASPNAASLGKFVDIPVNYYTGIPTIGIPIYTVKSGSLGLPISLSYHSSGLKVQEQASWVGAGWALNAGGVITRTVRGAPDEKLTNSTFQKYGYFSDYGYLSYMFKKDDGTPLTTTPSGTEFYEGRYDGEPDLFFFNFNGYSGKFYFNDDRTPVLMPEQDLKIEYDYTPGIWNNGPGAYVGLGRCIEGFIITTADGTKYYFGMTGSSPVSPYVHPIEVTSPYTLNSGSTYSRTISSWFLNKIVSADGGSVINLKYTRDSYAYYIPNASNPVGDFSGTYNTYDLVKNLVDGVKLSLISFSNGKVDFVAGAAREDLSNWTQPGGALTITDAVNQNSPTLGAIQISDNTTNGFCKKYNFTYSYFIDNITALPAFLSSMSFQTDKKRLRLDYLQETTCDASLNIPPYHFEYFSEQVPRTISFGMDHWGFINGAANSDLLPSLTKNNAAYITTSTNRESAWPAMRGGTLNKITFPTGGSNTYDYEANTFQVNNVDKIVGGLRIKTITQSDAIDPSKNIITSFSYLDNTGYSSSILYGKPVYIKKIRNDIMSRTNAWLETTDGCWPTTIPIYSRNSVQPMASTQGYHIGYSEVKVSQTNNGSSIYRYYGTNPWEVDHTTIAITNFNNDPAMTYGGCSPSIPNVPAAPLPNNFIRGELKYEGHYNQSGQLISEKEYYPVYQENPVVIPGYIFTTISNTPYTAVLGTIYELKTARKTSNTIIERTYGIAGQAPVETSTQTLYESLYHHQPTKIITTNSLGQTIEKRIKYSNDFVVPSVSNITNCNYQNYTNVVNSFPVNYQTQLNSCESSSVRIVCIGTVWYNYIKDMSNARIAYIDCRKTNYTNTSPLNTYQTNHNTAKTNANTELKPLLWMQDVFMNSPVETSEWKNNQLTNASYTRYSNYRDDVYGVYPDKTLKIDMAAPSATFTASAVGADNISISKDSRYAELSNYDFNQGNVISVVSRDGVPASYEWGYNQNFPVVKISNAANKYKENAQLGTVTNSFNFPLGPSNPTSGSLQGAFTQTQAGTITISIPGLPNGAQATANFTLTGPVNQSGYLCASGSGGASCSTTPSSISYSNMPAGQYTLSASVNTTFQSYTFIGSLSYSYSGMILTSSGLKEFFYEGFEENAGGSIVTGTAHTGTNYWNGNYTVPFSLPNARSYLIQWWNLSGGTWNFNQQAYTGSITLTGPVDDIRIFPTDAQISTYTYKPLAGMSSETNTNGRATYYEYDILNRLNIVKDNEKNVVKKLCYTYSGQTENCAVQTFYNVTKSGTFTRNNCSAGYIGSTVTYTVPAGTYTSLISQADADSKAQADVNANGQNYANTNGTCTQMVNVIGNNSKSLIYNVSFSNPVTGGTIYSFTLNAYASNITLGQVATGTYNVTFYPIGSPTSASYNVNGYSQSSSYGVTFYNISVTGTTTVSVN